MCNSVRATRQGNALRICALAVPAIRREGFDALLILQAFPVSASARFAPARLVRRKHKRAVCVPAPFAGGFLVLTSHDIRGDLLTGEVIGRGGTRGAAWRSAAFRVKTARD